MSPKPSGAGTVARQLIRELQSAKGVKIQCPCCSESRPASKYLMFAAGDTPSEAKELLAQQVAALNVRRTKQEMRAEKLEHAAEHAQRTNFGNFAERLIPATPAFPRNPADYRHLGSPIDYIAFHGISHSGVIDSIDFIDAKAGPAELKANQKLIANAVARGRVSVRVISTKKSRAVGTTGTKQ